MINTRNPYGGSVEDEDEQPILKKAWHPGDSVNTITALNVGPGYLPERSEIERVAPPKTFYHLKPEDEKHYIEELCGDQETIERANLARELILRIWKDAVQFQSQDMFSSKVKINKLIDDLNDLKKALKVAERHYDENLKKELQSTISRLEDKLNDRRSFSKFKTRKGPHGKPPGRGEAVKVHIKELQHEWGFTVERAHYLISMIWKCSHSAIRDLSK